MASAAVEETKHPKTPAALRNEDIALSVDQVSKKFCRNLKRSMLYGLQDIATELVGGRRRSHLLRSAEFWALDTITFQLKRGDALGLVGPNGAGKSTLLRIISGLIKPDVGTVRVRGRVAPLIALGAGFSPILTGRENIRVNMSILGLSKKEIDERFDQVVDFAEIGDALDSPVQTYSSGMAARLGFACAVHTKPDVLLVDEVLAVGDLKFRMKCFRHMAKLLESGTSFILVSHNPHAIMTVCRKAVYLSKGRLLAVGDTAEVMGQYEEDLFSISQARADEPLRLPEKSAADSTGLDITGVCFRDENDAILEAPESGKPTSICVQSHVRRELSDVHVIVAVSNLSMENERVLYLSSQYDNQPMSVKPGEVELQLQLPYCGLAAGMYSAKIAILHNGVHPLDVLESFRFRVNAEGVSEQNLFYQPRLWQAKTVSPERN